MKFLRRSLTGKVILMLVITSLLLVVSTSLCMERGVETTQMAYSQLEAADFMTALATSIPPGAIENYLSTGETDEDYEDLQDLTKNLAQNCMATSLGVYIPQGDKLITIWDYQRNGTPLRLGQVRPWKKGEKGMVGEILAGNDAPEPYYYKVYDTTHKGKDVDNQDQSWFRMASGLDYVKGSAGAVMLIDMEIPLSGYVLHSVLKDVVLAILLVMAFVMIVFFMTTQRNVLNPLKTLQQAAANTTSRLESGEDPYVSDIHTGDDIEALSHAFEGMEVSLRKYIRENDEITAQQARMGTELAIAGRIQEGLLPRTFPAFPDRTEFDLYASMQPAKEVGGDLYDFHLRDQDHLVMVIADVSGKGISAAMFMSTAMTMLRDKSRNSQLDPAQIFMQVNDNLMEINEAGLFITTWMGILTISTGEIVYANAGHERPAIRRGQGPYTCDKDIHGIPLGAMDGVPFQTGTIQLEPGDTLYLYTDGVPETNNISEEMFMESRMLEVLNRDPDAAPDRIVSNMKEALEAFKGEADRFDDTTMLCMKYYGGQG